MEHEVFVPVPAPRLRAALADPARIARAVPGLQRDAGADAGTETAADAGAETGRKGGADIAGRLKLRVGSHSVTYRGTLRVTGRDDGTCAVEGEATEARGTGTVKLALTVRAADAEGGTTLTFDGTATADGRITERPHQEVGAALTRLLTRFAEQLGEEAPEVVPESPEQLSAGAFEPAATSDFDTSPDADDAPAPSVFDVEVPPPSLDPRSDEDEDDDVDDDEGEGEDDEPPAGAEDASAGSGQAPAGAGEALTGAGETPAAAGEAPADFADAGRPPAEAAHARRTMIGRSAEEVDHAPPRGRYAPVPAPQPASAASTLRWVAPAAVAVVASAIVVGRVLRRRR
ncbi:carbon monoxide dehydrogenase [Streptomyces sp. Ru71]|uniref:carbon monoxide dehydrogenase n=1 Tax=Streptomyces sp. Ru71 TaxID=2080746 RepID=UPI000CDDE8EB|nr:carbon monoxide dehydrogenase [Streptomyces sp. Ru71]POX56903.1 carbon monoxide dehydrogenase [Streptomyces sp. Ru71]